MVSREQCLPQRGHLCRLIVGIGKQSKVERGCNRFFVVTEKLHDTNIATLFLMSIDSLGGEQDPGR